jgi:hypothetical protein
LRKKEGIGNYLRTKVEFKFLGLDILGVPLRGGLSIPIFCEKQKDFHFYP